MLRMTVKVVGLDQISMLPVVILTDEEERGFVPLVIGPAEANSISLALEGIKPSRPLTHDLMLATITALDGNIEKVVITDLRDDTYYATITLRQGGQTLEIDARPSDSIALAMRCDAPIYVAEKVAAQALVAEPIDDQEMEDFKRFLENITPEDFKKGN